MTTTDNHKWLDMNSEMLEKALQLLAISLESNKAAPVELVLCGGSALILTRLVARVTRDVDVVALMRNGNLSSPDPLPDDLLKAAGEVAEDLNLHAGWLNNGPSRSEGGLFQMGLPEGFVGRLTAREYGHFLRIHIISRLDQIHFKLYAAADRGGYHIQDLLSLRPTNEEIEAGARWAMTHDVSEGFAEILKQMLTELGYDHVAERL